MTLVKTFTEAISVYLWRELRSKASTSDFRDMLRVVLIDAAGLNQ